MKKWVIITAAVLAAVLLITLAVNASEETVSSTASVKATVTDKPSDTISMYAVKNGGLVEIKNVPAALNYKYAGVCPACNKIHFSNELDVTFICDLSSYDDGSGLVPKKVELKFIDETCIKPADYVESVKTYWGVVHGAESGAPEWVELKISSATNYLYVEKCPRCGEIHFFGLDYETLECPVVGGNIYIDGEGNVTLVEE